MSNGYLVAAEVDLAAAHEIGDGFGLEVVDLKTIGDRQAIVGTLAGAANVGILLSNAATRDAVYFALLQALATKLTRAQLILVESDALSHFGFLPHDWPAMPLDEARTRAADLARRRDAPPPPEEPQHAAPLEPAPQEPVPQPQQEEERERAITELEPSAGGQAAEAPGDMDEAEAPEAEKEEAALPADEAPPAPRRVSPPDDELAPPQSAPAPSGPDFSQERSRMTSAGDASTSIGPAVHEALAGAKAPADATAFAPKKLRRGEAELVRVVIHQPQDLKDVIKAARKIDPSTEAAPQGLRIGDIELGADIGVSLDVRGGSCDGTVQRRKWQGKAVDFNFTVEGDESAKQAILIARVFVGDAQIGTVAFIRQLSGPKKKAADMGEGARLKRHKRVFLSYSSQDRATVAAIATAYEAAGIPHFWDRASLKSGEEWSPRLRKEIDKADLFHLCWSKAASQSQWVEKEAEHALTRRKRSNGKNPDITVQMLDGPPWAPHPLELDSINFDDFVRAAVVGYARGDGS